MRSVWCVNRVKRTEYIFFYRGHFHLFRSLLLCSGQRLSCVVLFRSSVPEMARSGPFRPDERPHRFLFNLQPVDDYHKETKKYLARCRVRHDVQRGSNTKFYHSFSHFISFYFSSSRNLIVYRRRCDPILRRRPRNPSNSSQASCESSNLLSNYLLSNNRESQGEQ